MIDHLIHWLTGRRRRAERQRFADGYAWAKHAHSIGEYDAPTLLSMSDAAHNTSAYEAAWDRGVRSYTRHILYGEVNA